jgi:MFS family permease
MRQIVDLLKSESRARPFFLALGQSALGTGAALVALMVIAIDRFDSPWAIGLILLADVIPGMLLGPVLGAAADRFSRRRCMIVADVIRAGAFCGLVLVDNFALTVAFALTAGIGTALFVPASLASLPSLVKERSLSAATSLYSAITDLGYVAGPAAAAGLILLAGPELVLGVNAVTFALSALLLASIHFGGAPVLPDLAQRESLMASARHGLAAASHIRGLRLLLFASAGALFFAGLFNVGELLLARDVLGTGDAGFSALVAIYGAGFVGGSIAGAKGGSIPELRRRYFAGLLVAAVGTGGSAVAPSPAVAGLTFVAAGFGAGLLLVHERLLIQALVPDALSGRVFGIRDALTAWAWAVAFIAGPVLLNSLGTRETILIAGAGALTVWLVSVLLLARRRHEWEPAPDLWDEQALGGGVGRAGLSRSRGGGEHRPDLVRG